MVILCAPIDTNSSQLEMFVVRVPSKPNETDEKIDAAEAVLQVLKKNVCYNTFYNFSRSGAVIRGRCLARTRKSVDKPRCNVEIRSGNLTRRESSDGYSTWTTIMNPSRGSNKRAHSHPAQDYELCFENIAINFSAAFARNHIAQESGSLSF